MTLPNNESFVPLTPAAPSSENRDFQVTLIPQAEQPRPFLSLNHATPAACTKTPPGGEKTGEPHLLVHRDGGRITGFRIQCHCGQTMDLACVYDETLKTP